MTIDGNKPRLNESSQLNSKKRLYNHDFSMGNKDRVFIKNSQGGGYALTGLGVLIVG